MLDKKYIEEHFLIKTIALASIIFLVFSLSFFMVFLDRGFYDKSYAKYGAYESIGVEGVRFTTDALIKYMLSDNSDLTQSGMQVFIGNEAKHFKDVHALFKILKYLTITFIFTLLGIKYWMYKKYEKIKFFQELKKLLRMSSYATLILLIALIILSYNFNWLFEHFHRIFFPMGNYTFPASSLMIIMFPQEFFRDFAYKMLFHVSIIMLLLYFLGREKK